MMKSRVGVYCKIFPSLGKKRIKNRMLNGFGKECVCVRVCVCVCVCARARAVILRAKGRIQEEGREKKKINRGSHSPLPPPDPSPPYCSALRFPESSAPRRAVSRNQSTARVLDRQSEEIGEVGMGRDKRLEVSRPREKRGGQRRQLRSPAAMERQGRATGTYLEQ